MVENENLNQKLVLVLVVDGDPRETKLVEAHNHRSNPSALFLKKFLLNCNKEC